MNDDTDNVIEEDKKQHPKCGYSKQYSKECRSVNGKMNCKQIEQLFRVCPGKRPVEIHRKEISGNNDIYDPNDFDMDDEDGDGIWTSNNRSFDIDMEQAFQNQMMGLMQLAGLMMGAAAMDPFANEEEAEEYARRQYPFYDDTAPVPQRRQQQQQPFYNDRMPVSQQQQQQQMDPSFVAPHSNREPSSNSTSRKTNTHHHFSDYEDKTNEF